MSAVTPAEQHAVVVAALDDLAAANPLWHRTERGADALPDVLALTRLVVARHVPLSGAFPWCGPCTGHYFSSTTWPCAEFRAAAAVVGIEVPTFGDQRRAARRAIGEQGQPS